MTLASMTPAVVIDRLTLIVSDLDRAEDDYVKTFGCTVEQRTDIESELTRVLCIAPARGRRSSLRLGQERIELLEFCDCGGARLPTGQHEHRPVVSAPGDRRGRHDRRVPAGHGQPAVPADQP